MTTNDAQNPTTRPYPPNFYDWALGLSLERHRQMVAEGAALMGVPFREALQASVLAGLISHSAFEALSNDTP